MATTLFTLSRAEVINWQGTTGKPVKIQVVPKDTTISITLANVFYPGSTTVPVAGDKATFNVTAGRNALSVSVAPRTVPPIVWRVVEVGTDGTTQTLATVNDPDPQQDPYSTTVKIIGSGS
jgi:hypothetical protein